MGDSVTRRTAAPPEFKLGHFRFRVFMKKMESENVNPRLKQTVIHNTVPL